MLQRHRLFRTCWPLVAACALTCLASCKNENSPDYWLERLDQPALRGKALVDLEHKLEPKPGAPEKPADGSFADRMMKALEGYYGTKFDQLEPDTRMRLLDMITGSGHASGAAAVEKTFDAFGRGKATLPELDLALDVALDLPPKTLGEPLLNAFKAFHASQDYVRSLKMWSVMLRHVSPTWQKSLLAMLQAPILSPDHITNEGDVNARSDQIFWQTSAIELLGAIGGPTSVEPVLRILVDHGKEELHAIALLALVRMGDAKGKHYIVQAALVLGESRSQKALAPLLKGLAQAESDGIRAVIAREITKLPASPEAIAAFKKTYDELTTKDVSGEISLIESVDNFYTPDLVPWIIEQVALIKDPEVPDENIQNPALMAAVRLMTPDQMPLVAAAVQQRKMKSEIEAYYRAASLIDRCKRQISCYMIALTDEESQKGLNQITGIKAATMLGILGDGQVRNAILQRYERIKSPAVQLAAARAIEHLTKTDAAQTSEAIAKLLDHMQRSRKQAPRDLPLEYVRWRLANRRG
jgi:hypothetical protein